MNQEKIGSFIAKCRKDKKMTQSELAEKLGVTDKSIGIDYSARRINKYSNVIGLLFVIFGLFISMSAIMIFPSESSWGSIYSVFGVIIFVIGISKLTNKMKLWKKLLLVLIIFLGTLAILFLTDYINVKRNNVAPMFRVTTTYLGDDNGDVLYYDTPFYDVIKCNDSFNIVKNKNYTHEELFEYCSNNK